MLRYASTVTVLSLPVQRGVAPLAHRSVSASPSPPPAAFDGSPLPVPAPLSDLHTLGLVHQADSAEWIVSLGETVY